MTKVIPFRRRRRWSRPQDYGVTCKHQRIRLLAKLARWRPYVLFAILILLGTWDALRGGAAAQWSFLPWVPEATTTDVHAAYFPICGTAQRYNCVVDGDTFWFEGEKIRILGIDAPEVSEPECRREAELGETATRALRDLLNEGPFSLARDPFEPKRDRYGRLLRHVTRENNDLGDSLFTKGLAKKYRAAGPDWCD